MISSERRIMTLVIERVTESEVLVADFGSMQLYRIIEDENSQLESSSESES